MMQPSMDQFREFCAAQEPFQRYYWADNTVCACAQFAESLGMRGGRKPAWTGSANPFWHKANEIASVEPHTFGALRARIASYMEHGEHVLAVD